MPALSALRASPLRERTVNPLPQGCLVSFPRGKGLFFGPFTPCSFVEKSKGFFHGEGSPLDLPVYGAAKGHKNSRGEEFSISFPGDLGTSGRFRGLHESRRAPLDQAPLIVGVGAEAGQWRSAGGPPALFTLRASPRGGGGRDSCFAGDGCAGPLPAASRRPSPLLWGGWDGFPPSRATGGALRLGLLPPSPLPLPPRGEGGRYMERETFRAPSVGSWASSNASFT